LNGSLNWFSCLVNREGKIKSNLISEGASYILSNHLIFLMRLINKSVGQGNSKSKNVLVKLLHKPNDSAKSNYQVHHYILHKMERFNKHTNVILNISQFTFPLTYSLMGNQIATDHATAKIIYWDGSVQEFHQSLTVAELMMEHPQQVVLDFHSAVNQKRPTPLPADQKLEMKKTYVMVPVKQGKPVGLSTEDSRRILFIVNSALCSKFFVSSSGFLPWLAGLFRSERGVAVLQEKEMENAEEKYGFCEFLPEMAEGRPEYLSRQLSGKGWKPSLDTIKEKKVNTKVSRWLLFLKTFTAAKI